MYPQGIPLLVVRVQHRPHMDRNGLYFCFANKLAFQERIPGTQVPSLWCYFYTGVVVNIHISYLVVFPAQSGNH